MNTNWQKITRVSKILDTLMKIGGGLLILAVLTMAVLAAVAQSLDLASFRITGMWSNTKFSGGVDDFRALMILEILNGGIVAAMLFVASGIFKDMSSGHTPFTKKNVNRLRVISPLLIVLGVVVPPLGSLISLILAPSVDISFSLNVGYLVFAAMFFCLALVFEYGAELQNQADETL